MISLNDVLLAMSNIPVDDPIAEIWGRGLQGGYRIVEYTGSLPITINANGDALLDYRIYGADGGVGEPTESGESVGYKLPMTVQSANLFDKNAPGVLLKKGFMTESFYIWDYQNEFISDFIQVKPNTTYITNAHWSTRAYKTNVQSSKAYGTIYTDKTFTTAADENYIRLDGTMRQIDEVYVRELSSIPVYIGENQLDSVEGVSDYVDKSSGKIVRMIGEYTFTGDESFNKYGNSDVFYTSNTIDPVGITTVNIITMRCNHPAFTAIENKDTRYWLNPEADDICCFLPGGRSQVFFRSTSNFATTTECKAYLKAQYDNGTPVKISYWLKTPIEEDPPVPLPEIPTIAGTTVIDYDGTPKPSQMYVKYKDKG